MKNVFYLCRNSNAPKCWVLEGHSSCYWNVRNFNLVQEK